MRKIKALAVTLVLLLGVSACSEISSPDELIARGGAKSLYVHGEVAMGKSNYAEAIQYFEALDDRYPFSDYMEQAQVNLIYAYYSLKQYENAMAVADSYVNVYSQGKHIAYAYYMRGLIYFEKDATWLQKTFKRGPALHDLANLRTAYDNFLKVAKRFSSSQYGADAGRRVLYIRNQLAESELLAAKFYYQQHAYMAAINRVKYLLANFPGAPQQKQALTIMHKAYKQLNLDKESQKIARLMKGQ